MSLVGWVAGENACRCLGPQPTWLPGRILCPLPQDRQIPPIGVDPTSPPPRDLARDAETLEKPEGGGHGWRREAGSRRDVADVADRTFDERLVYPQRGTRTPPLASDSRAVAADRFAGGPGRRDRGFGHFPHTVQEEPQPDLPVAGAPGVIQELVVGAPLALEVKAEVEERIAQESGVAEHEGDQEASHAAVAVEEGVNGLELDVGQAGLGEDGKPVVRVVDEPLQVGHALLDVVGWRGNEDRVAGTRAADPVLGSPELAGHLGGAASARQQQGVHLAEEAVREGKAGSEAVEAVVEGGDEVRGFEGVGGVGGGGAACFVEGEVGQCGVDAFDLGGEDRLFADVAVGEEGGVGEKVGDGVEAAEGRGGGFEEVAEGFAGGDGGGGWEGVGDEGADRFAGGGGGFVGAGGFASHEVVAVRD